MEGLGLGLIAFTLILPLSGWYKFYPIPDFIAVLETPLYLVTMLLPLIMGVIIAYTNLWLGVLAIYQVMNMVIRPNTLNIQDVIWFATGCFIIEVVRLAVSHRYDYYIRIGFGFLGIFQSVYAIQQYMGYDILWFGFHHNNGFVHGTLGNPNYLASFQVLMASISPLSLVWFVIPGIVLSHSYLGVLGFILVMVVRLRNFWISYLAILGGLGIAGLELVWRQFYHYSLFWKISWDERLAIWWLSLEDIASNSPAFGFGLGGFFQRAPDLQFNSGLLIKFMQFYAQAHNEYVQYFYEAGVVGLALLVCLLVKFRKHLVHPHLVGIGITSFGMFPFHIMSLGIPACVLIGLAMRGDE